MSKRIASLTSLVVLAGVAVFAGSAVAGNGQGNGSRDAGTQAATAPEPVVGGTAGHSATIPPGQAKQTGSASTTSKGKGSADQNAGVQSGVKPTNATANGNKPTMCRTGGGTGSSATCSSGGATAATVQTSAQADQSKRYGDGTTAAQIANARGAPAGTAVFGPGNSQPHKVRDCRRNHWVDIHAVKTYSGASCTSQTAGATASTAVPSSSASVPAGATLHSHSSTGGVLGVTSSGGRAPAGGVLGALASVGHGTLPFTGFPLWAAVLASIALIVLGSGLRRRARIPV